MRAVLFTLLSLALVATSVFAQADDTPELNVITVFPNNAFNIAKNGQSNRVVFNIANKPGQDRYLTLEAITGAFLNKKKAEGQKGFVLRNMTTTPVKSLAITGPLSKPLQVPYDFQPEFKPQDIGVEFRLLVNDGQTGKLHNVKVYTGTVTVIEPEKNWLDPQLLSVYAILAGIVSWCVYWAAQSFPGSKSLQKREKKAAEAAKPAKKIDRPEPATTDSSEWLPQQPQARARKSRK